MRLALSIIYLVFFFSGVFGQLRKTDRRVIEEDTRYSVEKEFKTWAVNLGYGPIFMYGDINNFIFLPNHRIRFAPTLFVSKQLAPGMAIDFQYVTGEMYGESSNYYFKGELNELSFSGVFFINQLGRNPGPVRDRWNFYLKMGVGLNFLRSRLHLANTDAVVQESDLGIPSSLYLVYGYDPYSPNSKSGYKTAVVLPFGIGASYRINNSFDVGFESSLRFSTFDGFDAVLSGSTNDRYLYSGLHFSYKIGNKDHRHMRWTYRGYGFNIFGRSRRDPLQDEVNNLEEAIGRYADKDPVVKNPVVVSKSLITIYEALWVKSIFFDENQEYNFTKEDQIFMAEAVLEMKHNVGKYIELYGYAHTSTKGDVDKISSYRCQKVKDFMVDELGANPEYIRVFAKGAFDAFSSESGEQTSISKRVNNRVDIVFKN